MARHLEQTAENFIQAGCGWAAGPRQNCYDPGRTREEMVGACLPAVISVMSVQLF